MVRACYACMNRLPQQFGRSLLRRFSSAPATTPRTPVARAAAAAAEGRWPWGGSSARLVSGLDSVNTSPLFTSYFAGWSNHLVFHTLSGRGKEKEEEEEEEEEEGEDPKLSIAMFHDRKAGVPSGGGGNGGGEGAEGGAQPWQLVCAVTLGPDLCGHVGTLHGGLQGTLLDEAMGCLLAVRELQPALTAYLNVQYRGPAPVPGSLLLRTRIARQEGRKLFLEGELRAAPPDADAGADADAMLGVGSLVAEASALFVQPKDAWDAMPNRRADDAKLE